MSQWIGSGQRTTLAGDANVDIMTSIIKCVRDRVLKGARTFLVKVKAHRGEPLFLQNQHFHDWYRKYPPPAVAGSEGTGAGAGAGGIGAMAKEVIVLDN